MIWRKCLSAAKGVPPQSTLPLWEPPHTGSIVNSINDISVGSLGIHEVAESGTSGTFPWTTPPLSNNVAPAGISGNEPAFSPPLYYPAGGHKVVFYSYYPRTTATSGTSYITPPGDGTAPTFSFTPTGQEDIMHGASVAGGSYSLGTAIPITFKHRLTQIQLNVSALDTLLSSIKILSIRNTGSMNLEADAITYGNNTVDIALDKAGLATTAPVIVPADIPVYLVGVTFMGQPLPRKYLIKPTSGKFLEGVIYTVTL